MLDYSAALEANNDRAWFHEHHGEYERARDDYLALLDGLRYTIAECAPELKRQILTMQAKDWMYRVARDMRYASGRPPYDPAFRAYIAEDRKSWRPIGYFVRIAPGTSCFGTGLWCADTAGTNRARDAIRARAGEFGALLDACGVPLSGERLKTMPRGYSSADPAAEWLRYRSWALIEEIPDAALTSFAAFDALARVAVRRMEPVRRFLLEISAAPAPGDAYREFYRE